MPKGLLNLPIAFEEPHLRHFAGMALIHRFCQKLDLNRLLQRRIRSPSPRYRNYHPALSKIEKLKLLAASDFVRSTAGPLGETWLIFRRLAHY